MTVNGRLKTSTVRSRTQRIIEQFGERNVADSNVDDLAPFRLGCDVVALAGRGIIRRMHRSPGRVHFGAGPVSQVHGWRIR
jgi:hypothetical protein